MMKELQKPLVWQDRFFKQLAHPLTLLDLFDTIPHVYMYIKDTESRFVRANRVVCDVVGVGHPDEVIGHTDFDFFPPACTKIPLLDHKEQVAGIAGVKRPYEYSADDSAGYSRLVRVISFIIDNHADYIEVKDMAAHVQLSVSQLQREFSKKFGITPSRYLREVRVGMARHLLESSDLSLTQIVSECGFYDQSHLSRHFKASTGLTPHKYRQRFETR